MLPFIHTAETFYGPGRDLMVPISHRAFALHEPRALPLIIEQLHRRGEIERSIETVAWVENGAWIAQCPFCLSAQVVSPADPCYLCAGDGGCANIAVNGAHIPVAFPAARDRKKIEQALLMRQMLHNRNWLPHESHQQLLAENLEHDLQEA